MKRRRCQLLLDHATWDRLKAEAIRRGMSVSALVRQRLNGAQMGDDRPRAFINSPGPGMEGDRTLAPATAAPFKPISIFNLGAEDAPSEAPVTAVTPSGSEVTEDA